ncbi:hypothetical protein ACFL5G_00240 [Candidatus Margulisiibacteriota bacterium]
MKVPDIRETNSGKQIARQAKGAQRSARLKKPGKNKVHAVKKPYVEETVKDLKGLTKIMQQEMQELALDDSYDDMLFVRETASSMEKGFFGHDTAPYYKGKDIPRTNQLNA